MSKDMMRIGAIFSHSPSVALAITCRAPTSISSWQCETLRDGGLGCQCRAGTSTQPPPAISCAHRGDHTETLDNAAGTMSICTAYAHLIDHVAQDIRQVRFVGLE